MARNKTRGALVWPEKMRNTRVARKKGSTKVTRNKTRGALVLPEIKQEKKVARNTTRGALVWPETQQGDH